MENNTLLHRIQLPILQPLVYMDNFYNSVQNTELSLQHEVRTYGIIWIIEIYYMFEKSKFTKSAVNMSSGEKINK